MNCRELWISSSTRASGKERARVLNNRRLQIRSASRISLARLSPSALVLATVDSVSAS